MHRNRAGKYSKTSLFMPLSMVLQIGRTTTTLLDRNQSIEINFFAVEFGIVSILMHVAGKSEGGGGQRWDIDLQNHRKRSV